MVLVSPNLTLPLLKCSLLKLIDLIYGGSSIQVIYDMGNSRSVGVLVPPFSKELGPLTSWITL